MKYTLREYAEKEGIPLSKARYQAKQGQVVCERDSRNRIIVVMDGDGPSEAVSTEESRHLAAELKRAQIAKLNQGLKETQDRIRQLAQQELMEDLIGLLARLKEAIRAPGLPEATVVLLTNRFDAALEAVIGFRRKKGI